MGFQEILRSMLERLRLQWILEQSSPDLDYLEYVCNQEYILLNVASQIFEIPYPITEMLIQLGRLVRAATEEEQGQHCSHLSKGKEDAQS